MEQKITTYLMLISLTTALLSSCSRNLPSETSSSTASPTSPTVVETQNQVNRPLLPTPEDNNFVVEVVEKVQPAVVQINTQRTVRTEAPQLPDAFNDPFFRRFFGEAVPTQPQERVVRGLGSGFVINPNGQILTNAHVVSDADRVTVTFSNGRTYEGKVLGKDPIQRCGSCANRR